MNSNVRLAAQLVASYAVTAAAAAIAGFFAFHTSSCTDNDWCDLGQFIFTALVVAVVGIVGIVVLVTLTLSTQVAPGRRLAAVASHFASLIVAAAGLSMFGVPFAAPIVAIAVSVAVADVS